MQAGAGALADGEEAGQRGAPVEVDRDAAHRVVGGRGDRDRFGARVDPRLAQRSEDVGEAAPGRASRRSRCDRLGAVGLEPVEDRRRNRVARGQLVGEAAAGGVEQGRALAAHRLGDQQPVEARPRQEERGRVELAELEVGEVGAGGGGHRRPGADRPPGVGGAPPERRGAAGGQHGRRRGDRPVVGEDAVAALAVAPEGAIEARSRT